MLKTFRNGLTVLTIEAGAEAGPCTLCEEKDNRIAGLEGELVKNNDILLGHQEIIEDLKGEIELLSKPAPAEPEPLVEKEDKPSTTKEDKQANKRTTK